MAPTPGDHNWERWCGQHEARLDGIEDNMRHLFAWREQHEADGQKKYVRIMERLTSIETKLIFFAALAAAIGSMIPSVCAALVKHL